MKEIKCPNCGSVITVDDTAYATVLEQVRTQEFQKEIDRRMAEVKAQFKEREEAVKSVTEKTFEQRLADKALELSRLEGEITRLKGALEGADAARRSDLSALELSKNKELFEAMSSKDRDIAELKARLANSEEAHKVEILKERSAVASDFQAKDRRIIELEAAIKSDKLAAEKHEMELRQLHKLQLADKEAELERMRDFRLKQSTKRIGENLEQYCAEEFEKARCAGMFPNATFGKDNTVVSGTKGDFVFRDFYEGQEYISIMFEMKNEMDETATKHRNDDFLEKLDRDRCNKNCEYAILVSMLEQESELYNQGIVDKSHRYPKMLVVRPEFFIIVTRLLSESARKAFRERFALVQELEEARNQSMDFARFEEKINRFRTNFNNNVIAAHKKYVAANEGIDKVIDALEKQIKQLREIKHNFEASELKLLKANEMADEDLTVKKLTHGAPSIRKMINNVAAYDTSADENV